MKGEFIFFIKPIIYLLALQSFSHVARSQQHLSKIVHLNIRNERMTDALDSMARKGNFYFSYHSQSIPADSLITFASNDLSVKEILDSLLNHNFDYTESGKYVVLRPAPYQLGLLAESLVESDHVRSVSGYVTDVRTGRAIAGASVYDRRLLRSTLTDENGFFKFNVKTLQEDIILTVTKERYKEITVSILSAVTVTPHEAESDYEYQTNNNDKQVERTAFGRFLISSKQKMQSLNLGNFFATTPVQVSLTPGLSSHGLFSSQVVNKVSVNYLGGYTAGVNGFEVAGLFNINKNNVRYLQIASVFNIVGGSVHGIQLSGINNTVLDSLNGLQVTGFYNRVEKRVQGVQASGIFNQVAGNMKGVQLAGMSNLVTGRVNGLQTASLLNYTNSFMCGMQIAGTLNVVKRMEGAQMAGLGNISRGTTRGVQLAACFNYAKTLKGLQIGIINIADSSSGVSIGVFNFVRAGYHKLVISSNEIMTTNIAFKMGTAKLYSILMSGIRLSDSRKAYTLGFGLGHDLLLNDNRFSVSAELFSQTLYLNNWEDVLFLHRPRTTLNIRVLNQVSVSFGPAFNFYSTRSTISRNGHKEVLPSGNYPKFVSRGIGGWMGWELGIVLF